MDAVTHFFININQEDLVNAIRSAKDRVNSERAVHDSFDRVVVQASDREEAQEEEEKI